MLPKLDLTQCLPVAPQSGAQMAFAACTASGCIYGGRAFGGKTYGMLMEAARGCWDPNYTGIIFRRLTTEITAPGALWDTAHEIYASDPCRARMVQSNLTTTFRSGGKIKFAHLEEERTKLAHKGGQYCFIGFDQLETFSQSQFMYLLTRNRPGPGCNQRPYWRATCNAEPGWLADLLQWWWDPETGYPISERSGVIRYYTVVDNVWTWVPKNWRDPKTGIGPSSFTFIEAGIADNKAGMLRAPDYEARLQGQDSITRERLLKGNWLISEKGGMFESSWFKKVKPDEAPPELLNEMHQMRYWDLAKTEKDIEKAKDPDFTSGAKGGMFGDQFWITNIERGQWAPANAEKRIKQVAEADGVDVHIAMEQEHGSAGAYTMMHFQRAMPLHVVLADDVVGEKVERARPWAAMAQQGRVFILDDGGPWVKAFIAEATAFPFGKRDQVDSVSGLYKILTTRKLVFPDWQRTPAMRRGVGFKVAWQKLSEHTIPWISQWVDPVTADSTIICGIWQGAKGHMLVCAERAYIDADPARVLPSVIKMLIEISDGDMRSIYGMQWYGSPIMFKRATETANIARESTDADLAMAYSRVGVRLTYNRTYDELGAIALVSKLIGAGRLHIHQRCMRLLRQGNSWAHSEQKEKGGAGALRALLNVVSCQWESGLLTRRPRAIPSYTQERTDLLQGLERTVANTDPATQDLQIGRAQAAPQRPGSGWAGV